MSRASADGDPAGGTRAILRRQRQTVSCPSGFLILGVPDSRAESFITGVLIPSAVLTLTVKHRLAADSPFWIDLTIPALLLD